jgi:dTDP-4-dehydrorhamnose 3,5-epimerase
MNCKVIKTDIDELLVFEPMVYDDNRGFFFESFNQREFNVAIGKIVDFVQDNHSKSKKGVLRGLHYQVEKPQGKLVRVISGSVFDVAVDLRRSSRHFQKWYGLELSAENKRQLWVPPGFAHGFLVTSENAEVVYKTTEYWYKEHERTLVWNDSKINIVWPNFGSPVLALKDQLGKNLDDAQIFE